MSAALGYPGNRPVDPWSMQRILRKLSARAHRCSSYPGRKERHVAAFVWIEWLASTVAKAIAGRVIVTDAGTRENVTRDGKARQHLTELCSIRPGR